MLEISLLIKASKPQSRCFQESRQAEQPSYIQRLPLMNAPHAMRLLLKVTHHALCYAQVRKMCDKMRYFTW